MELGPFVKIISHDLRGPLGNMKNIADLFRLNEIEVSEAKMFMQHIEIGINRSLGLLDDLIEWSYATDENKKVTKEVLNVNELIDETIEKYKKEANKKNQEIKFSPTEIPDTYMDRGALLIILKNLLTNAIHFTGEKGSIKITAQEKENYLQIGFEDNGIGIPEKMHSSLFSMGKDNRRLGTNNEKGIGIGLFICKDLVKRNGGLIWVEHSKEEEGTNMMFSIRKATQTKDLD